MLVGARVILLHIQPCDEPRGGGAAGRVQGQLDLQAAIVGAAELDLEAPLTDGEGQDTLAVVILQAVAHATLHRGVQGEATPGSWA